MSCMYPGETSVGQFSPHFQQHPKKDTLNIPNANSVPSGCRFDLDYRLAHWRLWLSPDSVCSSQFVS